MDHIWSTHPDQNGDVHVKRSSHQCIVMKGCYNACFKILLRRVDHQKGEFKSVVDEIFVPWNMFKSNHMTRPNKPEARTILIQGQIESSENWIVARWKVISNVKKKIQRCLSILKLPKKIVDNGFDFKIVPSFSDIKPLDFPPSDIALAQIIPHISVLNSPLIT